MEQASTFGLMAEFTKENESTTKWKVKVLSPGVMDVVTLFGDQNEVNT